MIRDKNKSTYMTEDLAIKAGFLLFLAAYSASRFSLSSAAALS